MQASTIARLVSMEHESTCGPEERCPRAIKLEPVWLQFWERRNPKAASSHRTTNEIQTTAAQLGSSGHRKEAAGDQRTNAVMLREKERSQAPRAIPPRGLLQALHATFG